MISVRRGRLSVGGLWKSKRMGVKSCIDGDNVNEFRRTA